MGKTYRNFSTNGKGKQRPGKNETSQSYRKKARHINEESDYDEYIPHKQKHAGESE